MSHFSYKRLANASKHKKAMVYRVKVMLLRRRVLQLAVSMTYLRTTSSTNGSSKTRDGRTQVG